MTVVVTITHALTENTDEIFVAATDSDGGTVTLAQAIGLMELGKALLIEQA